MTPDLGTTGHIPFQVSLSHLAYALDAVAEPPQPIRREDVDNLLRAVVRPTEDGTPGPPAP